jgi:hypothetical protein
MAGPQNDREGKPTGDASSPKPELSEYLQETRFCDWKHPVIQRVLHEITNEGTSEMERAKSIFYYARDNIRFALLGSGVDIRASKTARMGYGDCGSKTNFHMALLRAAGIPARMRGIMAEFSVLKGIIPGFISYLSERFFEEDFHFWPECYLAGSWVACEALFDKELYEGALRLGLFTRDQIPSIDWDSENDLVLLGEWKTRDLGYKPSADAWMADFRKRIPAPRIVDRFLELWLAPLCRRQSDRVRKHSGEGLTIE